MVLKSVFFQEWKHLALYLTVGLQICVVSYETCNSKNETYNQQNLKRRCREMSIFPGVETVGANYITAVLQICIVCQQTCQSKNIRDKQQNLKRNNSKMIIFPRLETVSANYVLRVVQICVVSSETCQSENKVYKKQHLKKELMRNEYIFPDIRMLLLIILQQL